MIDTCVKAVKAAERHGADAAEAFVQRRRETEIGAEKGAVKNASTTTSSGLGLRVVKDHRLGFAYTTDLEDVSDAAERAVEFSKLGKEIKGFEFASRAVTATPIGYDERLAYLTPEQGLEQLGAMLDAAVDYRKDANVAFAGVIGGLRESWLVNSGGLEVADRGTYGVAGAWCILKDGEETANGESSWYTRRWDVDGAALGREAAEWAVKSLKARALEKPPREVLFHPLALREMFEFIVCPALYGEQAHKGESVYTDRLGQPVAARGLTLVDNPLDESGYHAGPVDDEGQIAERVTLIEDGVLKAFLYDSVAAAEYGQRSTASAHRAERLSPERTFRAPPTIAARNLTAKFSSKPLDALLKETESGLWVHSVLGAHTANPASGDFAVNAARSFVIENGEVAYPVKSAMVSGNFPKMLEQCTGAADDARAMRGAIACVGVTLPTMRFGGATISA